MPQNFRYRSLSNSLARTYRSELQACCSFISRPYFHTRYLHQAVPPSDDEPVSSVDKACPFGMVTMGYLRLTRKESKFIWKAYQDNLRFDIDKYLDTGEIVPVVIPKNRKSLFEAYQEVLDFDIGKLGVVDPIVNRMNATPLEANATQIPSIHECSSWLVV